MEVKNCQIICAYLRQRMQTFQKYFLDKDRVYLFRRKIEKKEKFMLL